MVVVISWCISWRWWGPGCPRPTPSWRFKNFQFHLASDHLHLIYKSHSQTKFAPDTGTDFNSDLIKPNTRCFISHKKDEKIAKTGPEPSHILGFTEMKNLQENLAQTKWDWFQFRSNKSKTLTVFDPHKINLTVPKQNPFPIWKTLIEIDFVKSLNWLTRPIQPRKPRIPSNWRRATLVPISLLPRPPNITAMSIPV